MKFFLLLFLFSFYTKSFIYSDDTLSLLKQQAPILFGSFSGNYSLTTAGGRTETGKIQYEYPGKLYLQKSDGSVIATNGHALWLFRARSYVCIRQDVGSLSGGISAVLEKYSGSVQGGNFVFINESLPLKQIILSIDGGSVKSIRFIRSDAQYSISFSGITSSSGRGSLYNFKPPVSVQMVINPLNN